MASGVEVEAPESILTQTREEANDGKLEQCQKITEVDTDGESFLYPPSVGKVAFEEHMVRISKDFPEAQQEDRVETVKEETTGQLSLDVEGQETLNNGLTQNGKTENLKAGNEETSNSSFEDNNSQCDMVNGEEMDIGKVDNGVEEILLSKIESEIIVKDILEKDISEIGISEDNTVEADGKKITGILDSGHFSQNGNDSSLGNDSEEKEKENREPSSEEPTDQDKQEDVVSSEERIHNKEASQVSRSTEIMSSEHNAVEEATTKDTNLETSEREDEKSAEILELKPENIQEINSSEELLKVDVEMTDYESDLQKSRKADSDEKKLTEDARTEVDITEQTEIETVEQSPPLDVNESIDNDEKEHCTEENIQSRDFAIEKIEELKRCTSPETTKPEPSNENLSLDETLESFTQKSEASEVEEKAEEPTSSPLTEKIDELEDSEVKVISEENHDVTPNATIEESSKAQLTEESLTDSHPVIDESAENVEEEALQPVAIEKLDSEANESRTDETRDVEEQEEKPTENLISGGNNNDEQDQCVLGQINELDSEGVISKAADVDQEATEVDDEEVQTVKQEATEDNIESRDFPIEKTEELEKSNAPETSTLEQSNENLRSVSSTQESEMSPMEENEAKPTTFPMAEEIDDTPPQLKAEENSSIRSTDIVGEADLPDSEHDDVIQDATEVENKETQSVKQDATEEDFQHVVEKEIIYDEEKTDGLDEDSSQHHDEKSTTKSEIEEIHVTDTAKDAEIANREFEESNLGDSIGNEEDIEASQSHSGKTNISCDEVQLAEVQEETEIDKQLTDSEEIDSNNLTDGISAKENPEPLDAVEELDSKSAAASDDILTSEQEVQPDEELLSEENNEGQQGQSVPEEDNATGPASITEDTNQEATEVENKETQTLKEEAKEENFQRVIERDIVDDEEKTNGADEKSSQQHDEKSAIESDIAETHEDRDEADNEIHGTDIVESEKIVDREFEVSNSGNSIGNEEAANEASQSHEENTNVPKDEVQLLELHEEAKIAQQLEDLEHEDSNKITDGIKENPEPADVVEKLETVTKPEAINDACVASDEADKSVTEGSSTVVEYENDKFSEHLSNNQDLSVAGMENELNDKEVQLNGETQSLKEEAVDEDLQEVASDEDKPKAANEEPPQQHDRRITTELEASETQKDAKAYEQSEAEESQQKDNATEEESGDQSFEENISSHHEIRPESTEVSPNQDESSEISDDPNQVTEVHEEAVLEEQEENLEEEDPKNIIDSVSPEEENFEGGSHVDPPKQLDESNSTQSENIDSEPREIVNQERNSDHTIGNEETMEPNQDENANISTDGIEVIEVHEEVEIDEEEEKVEDENPSMRVEGVYLEKNPEPAEDIEELECGTKSAAAEDDSITSNEADSSAERWIQNDNQGLSVTVVDNRLESEESENKGNDENQVAKGIELNEVTQTIVKEATDEEIQPDHEDQVADGNVDSQQIDESSTTEMPNIEEQKNSKTQEESGNEEVQRQATLKEEEFVAKTQEESGHEEIHGKETPTDEEFVDHSSNVTGNQEIPEVPPTQDETTMTSDDGNQATDVQEEVALGKLQENLEDEDTRSMSDIVSTEKNPGPAEAVVKTECSTTSDAVIESTITSDEAEKSVIEEKSMVEESPKHDLSLSVEQSPEPVDTDEKFDLESTTACEDGEAIEGQDVEETQNMKHEVTKEDFQGETGGKIGDDKDAEVACGSGESNETREIDIVKDKETVNEDSNSSKAKSEETIEAYPSQDENANISNDEIQVIGVQEEAKIEEQKENIEVENSSKISEEENAQPAEDDTYTETEDAESEVREEGFQHITNDEEKIMLGNVESPQQPRESNAAESENTELRDENAHEQSEGSEIHRADKVLDEEETMESNEEQNQQQVEASTSNIDDDNPVPSQDESNISNEETQDAGVPEEAPIVAQLDRQQDEPDISNEETQDAGVPNEATIVGQLDRQQDESDISNDETQNAGVPEEATIVAQLDRQQDESDISNDETQHAGVPEEATKEAQLDHQQDEGPIKSGDGVPEDEKLDKPEGGSESTKHPEANKAEEETTNMEVSDLEATSTENVTESGNTEAKSLSTKDRDIDLAECTPEREEDAEQTAEVHQINEETQDINEKEIEEDLPQTIIEERSDCEVNPMDFNTDNSQLENKRDISMSDEQCESVQMDGSDLDREREIVSEGLLAANSSSEVQKEQSTTADEASEQSADVEKDTLNQDESPQIPSDQPQVVEVKETEVRDRECQPYESENLENILNISAAQVEHVDLPISENKPEIAEDVKDELNEEQEIPQETIEEEEKQGTDSGKVKLNITNMINAEEETGSNEEHVEGNIVKTLNVFSPREIHQVDKDDIKDILPEIEQLEIPVTEEMAENECSQTNKQELEIKNGDTSTAEYKEVNIMAVQVAKDETSEEKSLEKETQDGLVVSSSEFEPTKDSELKQELVKESENIDESPISSDQEQSARSEEALKLHVQEPVQSEETDKEMVESAVNSEPLSEENQHKMNAEASDATICDTKSEEVKYTDEPGKVYKTETANTELTDSLHEELNASDAAETHEEQALVEESESAENVLTQEPNVTEENLISFFIYDTAWFGKEEEKQMVACYDNMEDTQNITLVKDDTSSQQSYKQGNIKEALDIGSALETEQVDDRKQFSPEVEALAAKEAEEVIITPQLEHKSRDVALAETNANQPTEKLHLVHTEREVMLPERTSSKPDCEDVEEVSAADIIASQIARAIEEEEQWEQQSSEQKIEKHEATELVPYMDDNTLENQVPKEENKNINSLEEKTKETCFPEERGIELEVQKDMQHKQEKVEKVDDSQMAGTEDLTSASQGTDSPLEDETSKVSGSSMDSSSHLNEKNIEDSNKSGESSGESPQVDSISDLIPEENSANSCTTDDNESSASIEKGSEIPFEERTISEEIDQEKHQKITGAELMADEKTVLTTESHQEAICDAAMEEVAELKGLQEASEEFPYEESKAQSQHEDQLASVKSLGDDEKPAITSKMIEFLDEKHNKQVQHIQKTIESPDKVEKATTEVEEERRTEFSDSLDSGKKAVANGKVSPLLDIPKTQATILDPTTPEATEERKRQILADDSDSPTEPKNPHNAITVTESITLENQQQATEGLEEDIVKVEDGKHEEIQQRKSKNELENTENNEIKTRSIPMDSSGINALTSQTDGHITKKVEQTIPKEEKPDEKEAVVEEVKTDEEIDESVDQSQEDLEQREMPITAEALGEMELKANQRKSSNILLGVGSKVKHSISKMKKAIACSSAQFSQEDVIIKVNKNKKA